jgi:hypothetical protein
VIRGRWYISARAVREYAAIVRRPVEAEEDFLAREGELLGLIAGAHRQRVQDNGLELWRTGRPLRLRLLVSHEPRPEGPLPQLVRVLPWSPRMEPR